MADSSCAKTYTILARGLWQPQDLRNLLWHKCVREKRTLANVARCDYQNNLTKMIEEGLNANFMTRERWFDPQVISELMEHTCGLDFLFELGVNEKQFESLELSDSEYEMLTITFEDVVCCYGKEVARHELKRLGHKTKGSFFFEETQPHNYSISSSNSSSDEEEPQQRHHQWII